MPQPSETRVRLLSSFLRWCRDSIRHDGALKAMHTFLNDAARFLRESTPEHKRRRYGDIEYDWDYHVDTTSATVTFRDRLLGLFHSPYQPTAPDLFREMMSTLMASGASPGSSSIPRKDFDLTQFCFIDLGSGKGRTLLMASEYPFRQIIGVELLPDLNKIAQDNIRKFQSDRQKCFNVGSICADALDFRFPLEPIVLYLFNPFPRSVLERVIVNLERSLDQTRGPVFVLYHNPLLEQAISLKKLAGTHQYVIYGNQA
jgi:SAM-dependent methyltransferase